ncbi:MAG: thermonuclease family protein, partial [candidate division Zixibacteria bacterium]
MIAKSVNKWLIASAVMIILALIFLLFPVTFEKNGSKYDYKTTEPRYSVLTVMHVIDGDSFILSDSSRARLIGLDTPEKGQPIFKEAKLFAESVLTGASIRLEYDLEPYDTYGRRLVYLFLDSISYNELVLQKGLASVYLFPQNRKHVDKLIEAQKMAREAKVGIWSLPESPPEDFYVNISGSYRFHRPLCPHLKKSDPANKRRVGSRDVAFDLGLSSCRFC